MVSKEYEKMMDEGRIMLLPDVFPWSGFHVLDNDISEGLVTSCSISTGASISSADIKFPKKSFGDHVKGVMPIKICIDSANNIVFRGFIIEENGILSESEDTVTVRALGYKWYFSKCTRVRGRWFTSDDKIPAPYGSPNTTGHGKLKYEMFRGPLSRDSGLSGYMQNEPCIFNEDAAPTCLTKTRDGMKSIFKYRKMGIKNSVQAIHAYNYGAHYWTFSSILAHIVYWWLDPYSGSSSRIRISNSSFAHLSRLSYDDSIPMDLTVEGMNPLEAIDKVVKEIPGKWIWYIRYYGSVVSIEVRNIDDTMNIKTLKIGDGSKQAENPANVASINVSRNYEETSSFLILKGGKLKLTTTVELQPVWEPHTVSGVANLPFSSEAEFGKWKDYINSQEEDKKTVTENELYERAFRYYCIPKEGGYLTTALENMVFRRYPQFSGKLRTMYSAVQVDLKKMLASNVLIDRELSEPVHPEFENPVFFAYDDYRNKKLDGTSLSEGEKLIYYDSGFNFDSDSGLVIFDKPQYCDFAKVEKPTETDETTVEVDGGVAVIDKKTTASQTYDINSIANISKLYNEKSGSSTDFPLKSRTIFCTLTITLDMPYIIGDDIFGLYYSEGGNFARYVDFDNNDLKIHVNAFYPILPNSTVEFKGPAYISGYKLTSDIEMPEAVVTTKLYPIEYTRDYEMYPDNNDKLLFQKLKNMKESILKYKETIDADLGVLSTTYELGDVIVAIENSKTDNFGSGYYGMKDYISQIAWSLEGDSKGYTTKLTCTNDVDFSPRDFDNMAKDTIRRPSILRGSYKLNSYVKEDNDV